MDNLNVIALDHLKMNVAFVGNNEQFDNEIWCHACQNCLPGIFNDFDIVERASCQAGFLRADDVPTVRGWQLAARTCSRRLSSA